MEALTRTILFIAMVMLAVVSMWTTYVSLRDSILPTPEVDLPLFNGAVWTCSIFALLLAVAIGLMLFALKLAIIDGQKRINFPGLVGMIIVAFISITFSFDVLYRTADPDVLLNETASAVRGVYDEHLASVQTKVIQERERLLKDIPQQDHELKAEPLSFRDAPSEFEPGAYDGTDDLAEPESEALEFGDIPNDLATSAGSQAGQPTIPEIIAAELETITAALAAVNEANELLRTSLPRTVADVEQLENQLRGLVTDATARAGIPMPEPVRIDTPLFAVLGKLLDWKTVGLKEIFFLAIAIILDLGDIIGYSLIPSKPKTAAKKPEWLPARKATIEPGFEPAKLPTNRPKATQEDPFDITTLPAKTPNHPR